MKEAIKTVYSCGYCNRKMFVKNACFRHETVCSKNPANFIMCTGCDHCAEVRKDIYIDTYCGEYTRDVKSFYCKAKEVNMYPPKTKNIAARYPDSFEDEILMPTECDLYKSDLPF